MKTNGIFIGIIALVVSVGLALWLRPTANLNLSSASGLIARVATTSNPTVGMTAAVVFATSTCSARIITTVAKPIMIVPSNYAAQTPTGTFGHYQAASTTVAYDSGIYGCGQWKIYGFDADTLITVTETR